VFVDQSLSANALELIMHLGNERTQLTVCVAPLQGTVAQHQRTGKAEASVAALDLWCVLWRESQEIKG